ncbi:MAG: energy transducer TonB [Bacteroidales bacterium]|jgi:TonB family protein|nr:energy transducer TonB [Bacteroidales bacterium]
MVKKMFRKMIIVSVSLVVLFLFSCKCGQKLVNVDENPLFNDKPAEVGFREYIVNHTIYMVSAMEDGITGRVFVEFLIEKDGSVSNVKIVGSLDPVLDAEALRVVNSSPSWTPGKIDGKPVRISYTLPFKFSLDNMIAPSSKKTELSEETLLLEEIDIKGFSVTKKEKNVTRD